MILCACPNELDHQLRDLLLGLVETAPKSRDVVF
jgi:hypothetical protein